MEKNVSLNNLEFKILDKGYLRYVNHMGSDEEVVEAARMSTGKGFLGWFWEKDTYADVTCSDCGTQHIREDLPREVLELDGEEEEVALCTNCWGSDLINLSDAKVDPKLLGKKGHPKDLSLLETLMANRHATPFEMGELVLEVKAPIMVFREWHRHRTQSYNEMSGRYIQMPNDHYVPPLSRIQKQSKSNKQGSEGSFPEEYANKVRNTIASQQQETYDTYDTWVRDGVAKEIARVNTPVTRYSRMRAKANLRNWLAFFSLRMDKAAQWEIQQYATAAAYVVKTIWPRSFELWMEHEFLSTRFSRSEMEILQWILRSVDISKMFDQIEPLAIGAYLMAGADVSDSKRIGAKILKSIREKVEQSKKKKYEDTLYFLNNGKAKEPTI